MERIDIEALAEIVHRRLHHDSMYMMDIVTEEDFELLLLAAQISQAESLARIAHTLEMIEGRFNG